MRAELFFSESLLAQALLAAVVALASINSGLYATLLLAVIYVFTVAASLVASGFQLAGVFLLLAELHVVYIVFCLALGWVRFDTVSAASVESSTTLYYAAASLAAAALVVFTGVASAGATSLSAPYAIALLSAHADYTISAQRGSASALPLLAFAYTNSLLAEFAALNILMFVAAYIYYKLRAAIREAAVEAACPAPSSALDALKSAATPIRAQGQLEQLEADTATRCVTSGGALVDDEAANERAESE